MRKLSDTQLLDFLQKHKVTVKLSKLEQHPVHSNCFQVKFIASTPFSTCEAFDARQALTDLYERINGPLDTGENSYAN